MKGTLAVLAVFAAGCIAGWAGWLPFDPEDENITMYILYALMFLVGLSIGSNPDLKSIITSVKPKLLLLPAASILGTLAFSAAASLFLRSWGVTDCQICFDYGVYYSPVSTPADFRFLAPIVLEQALKKAGTQLLEPYLSFTLFAPQEYLSRAYNDAPKYCAIIESTRLEKDEVIFKGEIPARCIGEYRNDLNFYTNGRSVCITELKGYQETSGEPVFQPRRPNSRLDKVRHMFQKIM